MHVTEKHTGIKCALCGAEFDPDENTCGGCVIRKDCKLVCCPSCGFGMPKESNLTNWLKRWLKKQRS